MCGIFGALGWVPPSATSRQPQSHRGPDDYANVTGQCAGTDYYLDHQRLSIIGLGDQGRQPFVSEDGSVTLTYNGEIYNYERVKDDLRDSHDVTFQTTTDTEVLLKAYVQWGIDRLLEEVVGMFAFGLVDENTGTAYVVRDQMGVKPVYYHRTEDGVCFASEVKAILQKTDTEARLNRDVLGEYLANFWVYEPDTMFEGIFKLEAGHYLTYSFDDGTFDKQEYWNILDAETTSDVSELSADIETGVRDQLVSDVPVGMYLSGGIDSSLVAYHAAQEDSLEALNLRNDQRDRSGEYENVERLESTLDLDVSSFSPDESMFDIYREMVYYLDEPIADPAVIPAFLLAEESNRRGNKVMLSGMGGDELFAGYRRLSVLDKLPILDPLSPLLSLADRLYPDGDSRRRRNLQRVTNFLEDPTPENYHTLSYYFSNAEISALLGDDEWEPRYERKIQSMLAGREFTDELQKYQYLDVRGYLSSHNLIYMDKASMAASVEVRVPLLDHRFASKYFNLPSAQKMDGRQKAPLKREAEDKLGSWVTGGKKQGFGFPIEEFIQSEAFREELDSLLSSETMTELFDQRALRRLVDRHDAGEADNSMKIWAIYTLWLWIETFDVSV